MSRRLLLRIPPALLLGVCLVILPACKKKPADSGGGGDTPAAGSGPGGAPSTAGSGGTFVFVHFDAKSVRESTLFAEIKQSLTKPGGSSDWDKMEAETVKHTGLKPTDVESVTVCIPEFPTKGEPKLVAIVAASKAFNKTAILEDAEAKTADASGFYKVKPDLWLHFPDDKTLVAVSPDLGQYYLNGYAKNRTGWPMAADHMKAATGHTLYAHVNIQKLPFDKMDAQSKEQFAPLVATRTVTLTADLKGKEVALAVKGSYPDAATAGKAKEMIQGFVGMAAGMVKQFGSAPEAVAFAPVLTEVQRAIGAIKIDTVGSDVTIAGSYKIDFDVAQMTTGVLKKFGEAGERLVATNNLKQIGLAFHNYESTYRRLPISGVGANRSPLQKPADKPLLSWRVAILPYIEQDTLYKQFKLNEPWDSENNKKLIDKMPKIFAPEKAGKPGYTHLQMVVGPGAMQPGMTFASITDGTSNTIAVVEAAEPVIWTKPDDVMMPAKWNAGELKKKFGGQTPGGFNVVMWDGRVMFVPDSVSERTLSLVINPNDGQVLPGDWGGAGGGFAPPPPKGPGGGVPPKGPGGAVVPPKGPTAPVPPSGRK